jgi:methylenetetrahydrofolate dehydrogenase (NADP+)/methenyltetrahydrofolate cyclohydrolase
MTQILYAHPVVDSIKSNLTSRISKLKSLGITPSMCVILVGENPASLSYIRNKKKLCEDLGADFRLEQLNVSISREDFLKKTYELNNDPSIHGIIIQLPVSEKINDLDLPNLISPHKDIDGFHGQNTQQIYAGSRNLQELMPCTPKGVIRMLDFYNYDLAGKQVVVIGRSQIVGKPLGLLLSNFNATVTLAHSKTKNLRELTRSADIVIAAIGKANFLDASYFNKASQTIVIDVGMNSLNGKLTGDVDAEAVLPYISALSPVPGGVGPMTVVSLIENLITATEKAWESSLSHLKEVSN